MMLNAGMFHFLMLAGILFLMGMLGVMWRKNAIVVFMSIELMLNAANLVFVTFSRFMSNRPEVGMQGHLFAFVVMVVAACEVAVGLAIIVVIFRNKKTIDVDDINILKG